MIDQTCEEKLAMVSPDADHRIRILGKLGECADVRNECTCYTSCTRCSACQAPQPEETDFCLSIA